MLVAGVDSSTQSCKVLVIDPATGQVVRSGSAPHPEGTEVHPEHWWKAFAQAVAAAGGLKDVSAIGIGGQQHGMVLLDDSGEVVRPALLWNDTRSAAAAADLVNDYGATWWAEQTGSVPVASFTVTKLAWIAATEPDSVKSAQAVCLPHDWITYRLRGGSSLVGSVGLDAALTTDRGDASGTGYWSPARGEYVDDLLPEIFGKSLALPKVLEPWEIVGNVDPTVAAELGINPECRISVGSGDNMAAALGLGLTPGSAAVSIGTSGTVFTVSSSPTSDAKGLVAGFADATGNFLPLACTLNATQVLDRLRTLMGMSFEEFDAAALSSAAGANGLTLLPYFQGERTPNLPDATGVLAGLTLANANREALARAGMEGIACSLRDALEFMLACGVEVDRLQLIGGGARSQAMVKVASAVFGRAIALPPANEYVALGMAVQAARALGLDATAMYPQQLQTVNAEATPAVFEKYRQLRG